MPKDLFSERSEFYARYRPTYPRELFDYVFGFVDEPAHAWDCATGNGQAAVVLAGHFTKVDASDISAAQLEKAVQRSNIRYYLTAAEHTPFAEDTFDLITVAQAYHWLDWKAFHTEATRVGKQNAVVAIWTYNLFQSGDEPLNEVIHHFYHDITGPYWDPARKYVQEGYRTVAFEFEPLPSKEFAIELDYNKEEFKGYLSSWSAVQDYIRKNGTSPLHLIENDLDRVWNTPQRKKFHFPLMLRMGRIRK